MGLESSPIYSAIGTLRNDYGLDMNNVMDNNWVLFCIWRVALFVAQFSQHAYQTTPTECTCARPTLCIRISSINCMTWNHYFLSQIVLFCGTPTSAQIAVHCYMYIMLLCIFSILPSVAEREGGVLSMVQLPLLLSYT